MLAIRLARVGAKKKPAYRVVVTEKSRARNSGSLEILGHYNPTKDPILLSLKRERIDYWIGKGAQPSKTVERLMRYEPPEPGAAEEKATDTLETIAADKSEPATETKTEEAPAEVESAAADTEEAPAEVESAAEAESAVAEDPKG